MAEKMYLLIHYPVTQQQNCQKGLTVEESQVAVIKSVPTSKIDLMLKLDSVDYRA